MDCGRLRVLGAFLLVSLYGKRHADWFIRAARELTDINDCTTGVSVLGFSSAESLRESIQRCSLLYIDVGPPRRFVCVQRSSADCSFKVSHFRTLSNLQK